MTYAYVFMVRPGMEGADVEMMDVSDMLNATEKRIADEVLVRMGEQPIHDWKHIDDKAQSISPFYTMMRARLNNMEGPFLIKTEEPIDVDTLTALVRDPEMMNRFRKKARLYGRKEMQ